MSRRTAGRWGPRSRPRPRGHPGFTLLEVLVALALMSLLAGVLLQVMTVGLRAQKSSQLTSQALEVAGVVLQEYTREEGRRLTPGVRRGTEGVFAYEVTVEPQYTVPVPGQAGQQASRVTCFLVRVTVSWQERGRVRSLGLSTLRTVTQRAA